MARAHVIPSMRSAAMTLAALTLVWLVLRRVAASHVGFGDSEALYASYALHPQPAYLDHPGLIGLFARVVGEGTAPTPVAAHQVSSWVAAIVPWLLAAAARGSGASWRASFIAGAALACVPEIAVGLFAMTPDLLLSVAWIAALGCATFGLRAKPSSVDAAWSLAAAGVLAGIACASKATGGFLIIALVVAYLSRHARAHAATIWPWVGIGAGLVVVVPIAIYEARSGFPMLVHRFVDTQHGAGVSLRNLAAIVFGQLAYVSPLFAVAAFYIARDLISARARSAVDALLFISFAVPLAFLVCLALWSRVAEPHWLAPPLLALVIHHARAEGDVMPRRLGVPAVASGLVLSLAIYAWVLVPSSARLLPASVDMRLDLANELFGWPRAIDATRAVLDEVRREGDGGIVVVGPHWVVCAQLQAALGTEMPIGCDTPIADDFDTWLPRPVWRAADNVVFVTDNRFAEEGPASEGTLWMRDRACTLEQRVTIVRGGRVARVFTIRVLSRRTGA